jgi:HlyD family secretion protein
MTNNIDMHRQNNSESNNHSILALIASGKRSWVILIFAVTALVVLALLVSMKKANSGDTNKAVSTFTARRDDLTITVTESGSIKARNSIDIKSEVEGEVTIINIVPEGTYISQEDVNNSKVLVELDSSVLREQLAPREIDFAGAEASYTQAKEAYDIQSKQNESDITAAELKAKFALMDFKKYVGETTVAKLIQDSNHPSNPGIDIATLLDDLNLRGAALQRLNELKDSIFLARAKWERARTKFQSTLKLYDANYVSRTELEADRLDVNSFDIQHTQAQRTMELFKLYDFPKEAEKFLSDYVEANRQLERTHALARSKIAQALALLKSAEAEYQLKMERLEKVKKQIAACIIRAPAPGLVVYSSSGDFWHGRERAIEEGGTVYQRQKIISLPNTSEMVAQINVHESLIDKVRPGQTVKITIDAFPDKTFNGEVLKIAPLPDPQRGWMSPDLKVYSTEVSIDGSHTFLKPGMSAKVEILVEQLYDVIIVPVQVIANHEGKKICHVMTSQGPKQREVVTGAFSDTFVEIVSGLEVGEEVLLNPPRLSKSSDEPKSKQTRKPPEEAKPPEGTKQVPDEKPPQSGVEISKTDSKKRTGDGRVSQNP